MRIATERMRKAAMPTAPAGITSRLSMKRTSGGGGVGDRRVVRRPPPVTGGAMVEPSTMTPTPTQAAPIFPRGFPTKTGSAVVRDRIKELERRASLAEEKVAPLSSVGDRAPPVSPASTPATPFGRGLSNRVDPFSAFEKDGDEAVEGDTTPRRASMLPVPSSSGAPAVTVGKYASEDSKDPPLGGGVGVDNGASDGAEGAPVGVDVRISDETNGATTIGVENRPSGDTNETTPRGADSCTSKDVTGTPPSIDHTTSDDTGGATPRGVDNVTPKDTNDIPPGVDNRTSDGIGGAARPSADNRTSDDSKGASGDTNGGDNHTSEDTTSTPVVDERPSEDMNSATLVSADNPTSDDKENRKKESKSGKLEPVTAADVFSMAKMGDEIATGVVRETCRYLGLACVNICRLVDPNAIFIAGGMSKADGLVDKVRKRRY